MPEKHIEELKHPPMSDGWYVSDAPLPADPLERLLYYARLAPSSHNSQPWKFVIGKGEIDVFADLDRWLRVADPVRRELHASLGCAIESIRIAADYAGFGSSVAYFPIAHDDTLVARIRIALQGPKRNFPAAALLEHMIRRRTSHRAFERERAVPDEVRKAIYQSFEVEDVSLHFLQEWTLRLALAELEKAADTRLFANPAYREELGHWVGEGLLGTTWLVSKLGQFAVGHLPVAERVASEDAARLASAPLIGLLSTRRDRPIDAVRSGEAYMRIALMAESRGVRMQPVSQILEVPETRAQLTRLFDLGDRVAQHLFRIGYAAAETGPQRRRPLADMVIRGEAP
ncbi:MAG: nitroreductase family protein [Burkholderiales bacterium]